MSNKNNKREKLLAATDVLFLQSGLDSVTLSDIAHMANVPLGNIYYYFKSKDLMLQSVLKIRFSHFKIDLIKLEEKNVTAKEQLKAFIEFFLGYPKKNISEELKTLFKAKMQIKDFNEEPFSFGKFVTLTLCEFEKKQNKHLFPFFQPILELAEDWCEKKFSELDSNCDAKNNTVIFLTTLVGACGLLLNSNVTKSEDSLIKSYISFISKQFDLDYGEGESNIAPFPDKNSAWRK